MAVNRVLDLCTGSGCLAILARGIPRRGNSCMRYFGRCARGRRSQRPRLSTGGACSHLQDRSLRGLPSGIYDLIISNPPYVTAKAVEAFPPEYRAEPQVAHLGGVDGLDLVRRILDSAGSRLTPDGTLIVEVGIRQRARSGAAGLALLMARHGRQRSRGLHAPGRRSETGAKPQGEVDAAIRATRRTSHAAQHDHRFDQTVAVSRMRPK